MYEWVHLVNYLPLKSACSDVTSPNPVVVANGEELELLGRINLYLK